jgi:undecaprenyl diphosphate synthase
MAEASPASIKPAIPTHIAFIMDGNGRWAQARGLPRREGHRAGMEAIRGLVRHLGDRGIPFVTLYAFSTENWARPEEEVKSLFRMMAGSIKKEAEELNKHNVRIRHLGRTEGLSPRIVRQINDAVELTSNNDGLTLAVALNYGGRQEITDAVHRAAASGAKPGGIDVNAIAANLYTAGMPDVDLVVRTAGEMRISNFLLWQSAYAEFYSTPVLWPDFGTEDADRALADFAQRKRRFGGL